MVMLACLMKSDANSKTNGEQIDTTQTDKVHRETDRQINRQKENGLYSLSLILYQQFHRM